MTATYFIMSYTVLNSADARRFGIEGISVFVWYLIELLQGSERE